MDCGRWKGDAIFEGELLGMGPFLQHYEVMHTALSVYIARDISRAIEYSRENPALSQDARMIRPSRVPLQ